MNQKIINTLMRLGLTEYESKTYLALAYLITAKAEEISKESQVPRSKIYQTLAMLEEKGFITITNGRPLKYTILSPDEPFEKCKMEFIDNINNAEKVITDIYESKLPSINTPIYSIENENKILSKEYELIKRTRKVLYIRLGFILPKQIDNFKKLINNVLKKNIEIKLLTVPVCTINNKKIKINELFEDMNIEIKYAPLPEAQLIIRDNKEMILTFADNLNNSSKYNLIGLWNHYPTIIYNYVKSFEKYWLNK